MITIFSIILISESFVFEDFLDGSLSKLQFLGYSEEIISIKISCDVYISSNTKYYLIPISSILFNVSFLM